MLRIISIVLLMIFVPVPGFSATPISDNDKNNQIAVTMPTPVVVIHGNDFGFPVSLDLRDIHQDVDQVKVSCAVRDENTVIGSGELLIDVPQNGIVQQDVTLSFNASNGNPASAVDYNCILQMVSNGSVNIVLQRQDLFQNPEGRDPAIWQDHPVWAKAKDGTPFFVDTGWRDLP